MTLMVTAPLPVPEAGEGDIQEELADAPGEGAAPGVADGEGLCRRIAASLVDRERQARRAHTNGRGHRCGGDGEGDGDGDRGVAVDPADL